jgi:polysaccharide pyruvyl transferase WcaK-like protein
LKNGLMRVLIEPSDYVVRNLGDTAMLTMALERISRMWPDARIQVFTEELEQMPAPGPNIEPLAVTGRRLWFDSSWLPAPLLRRSRLAVRIQRWMRRAQPALTYRALRQWGGLTRDQLRELYRFYEAITGSDVLVVTGMGGVTSSFATYAFELLEVVRCAQRFGAKTAMMGQGLGPIETSSLRRMASDVLRRLDLLTLREGRASMPLLKRLGVPLDHVFVTGDDAIELAARHASSSRGNGIGINLRNAKYAGTLSGDIEKAQLVLARLSKNLNAPLVGIPISRVPGEEDALTIMELGKGQVGALADLLKIQTAKDAVVQLRRCRILVAGSYHAGVFALSCGIPTVALVRSNYYADKFLGLAHMFETGCRIVRFDDPNFHESLIEAAEALWNGADALLPSLQTSALRQLRHSRAAYARLRDLVV